MAGRKVFTSGEILTAADVNSFLMDQSVMVFADSSARSSAIPSPTEGMVTYLDDTDDLQKYDGSTWATVGNAGIGSNIVSTNKTDVFSASLASGASTAITGLSVTITPTSTTSKILVIVSTALSHDATGTAGVGIILKRGATVIAGGTPAGSRTPAMFSSAPSVGAIQAGVGGHFVDSPATTGATTYSLDAHNISGNTGTIYVNRGDDDADNNIVIRSVSSLTAIEVAA